MTAPLLVFSEVTHTPPGSATTLSGLSLAVNRGEFFVLLAADGAARRDLALAAAGLLRPDRGLIRTDAGTGKPFRAGIVFSSPGQGLFAATVREEIMTGLEWRGLSEAEAAARAEVELRRFGLWEHRDRAPSSLSGGEKQRLAIAAALAVEADLLILDEPTAMLDPAAADEVYQAARAAAGGGRSVLWLTGEASAALAADRAAILAEGRIVWTGDANGLAGIAGSLAAWGLRPPPLVPLREELRRCGVPLSGRALRPAELVEELCSVWPE